jgi:hypothetical protein
VNLASRFNGWKERAMSRRRVATHECGFAGCTPLLGMRTDSSVATRGKPALLLTPPALKDRAKLRSSLRDENNCKFLKTKVDPIPPVQVAKFEEWGQCPPS